MTYSLPTEPAAPNDAAAPGPALLWGVAFSAVQAEGAALGSDWFAWEHQGEVPPSMEGAGFGVDYADDLRLIRSLGADCVRLTVDWSRLEPEEGHVEGGALDRYRDVLLAARSAGLACYVVLVDGPLPGWFAIDERGWRDRRARSYFWPRHVERVAEHFGSFVAGWVPILRPVSYARASFVNAAAPPGTRSIQRFVDTVQGNYLASFEAWRILRGNAPVAIGVQGDPVRQGEEGAEGPARLYDNVQWAWTAALRDGELQLPRLPAHRIDAMRDAFDAVAFTFEGTYAVGRDGRVVRHPQPDELVSTLHRFGDAGLEKPLWLVGHSASQGDVKADSEAAEIACRDVAVARADGVDIRVWMWEPAIDGYEGKAGFDAKLGLFDRDRIEKPAADVLRRWYDTTPSATIAPVTDDAPEPSAAPDRSATVDR